jgi:uncharacterized protein
MITKSFLFLDGVGAQKEQSLWREGITDWHSFVNCKDIPGISPYRKHHYDRMLLDARKELYALNSSYFVSLMPQSESWRLYGFFKEEAVFLDIETTGLGSHDDVTVVGLYDGKDTKTMIRGINLNHHALREELSKYKLIVTFNGATFDLPFLQKRYPKLIPRIPHVDLRTITGRLGYGGGLKVIEKEFGVSRRELVERMHGGDAALLWRMYYGSGDDHYLKLLVEYNEEDIINLKKIADICTKRMEEQLMGRCSKKNELDGDSRDITELLKR